MGYSRKDVNIDLHIHSTASDGTLSSLEILKLAEKLCLGAISITDHDAVDGNKDLLRQNIPTPVAFLTGVEISASPPPFFSGIGSFHILGYGINVEDNALNQKLNTLQDFRKNRNPQIIQNLNALGIQVALSQVKEFSGECQLGRPHIARYLVQKGFVSTIDEAFDKYLGKGKAAYVEKFRISCREALQLICDAGGLPVLAHPYLLNLDNRSVFEELIITLKSMGLKGIEIYYPEHPPEMVNFYTHIAKKYDLITTGGTDFHGDIKPEIQLGYGYGNFSVSFEIYENIINFLNKGL
ncbi:MAG: PHP domain-containing protein [Desulfobacterales bacterium]